MENLSLTPATQAVLDALTELGQGNVHELADKAGKARSTTDKAIKTLADAGLIAAVDTDADPAEGTPTRWSLATPTDATDATPDDTASPGDEHTARTNASDHADQSPDGEPSGQLGEPIDIDGNNEPDQDDETRHTEGTAPDADTAEQDDDAGESTDLDDVTGNAKNDGDDEDTGEDDATEEARPVAVVQPARPGDRKVMAIKGVLADYGDDGVTLDLIIAESGIGHVTATRLLTAMEQADAARRLPGEPQRWIPGPTKASEVDPNPEPPRCPLCRQVIRGLANTPSATAAVLPLIRPDGTLHIVGPDGETHIVTLPTRTTPRAASTTRTVARSGDGTVNADGNQPFGRGELERLTLDYLAANPGHPMTPQDIATALAAQLNRAVSNGAVRNNLTKAAAAGRILLVSDNPLTFVHPAPTDSGAAAEADQGSTEQS
ncbi:MarR family winged helix-turn-helix transcriptional regulator [Micromonospora maris]|uniref:MarR family winged helix-turn-helix transcriptional regulator n=1 Tax=Micromonospora maris TaxID=1003110 RepID=UPI002E154B05|nr:MarR family winged helix-turn-helix transcriptional regulator [Micromonospora maris]